jgi:hypothetical protein
MTVYCSVRTLLLARMGIRVKDQKLHAKVGLIWFDTANSICIGKSALIIWIHWERHLLLEKDGASLSFTRLYQEHNHSSYTSTISSGQPSVDTLFSDFHNWQVAYLNSKYGASLDCNISYTRQHFASYILSWVDELLISIHPQSYSSGSISYQLKHYASCLILVHYTPFFATRLT